MAGRVPVVALLLVALAIGGCLDAGTSSVADSGFDGEGTSPGNATTDATFAPGWPNLSEARIRPGADLGTHPDVENRCTASFVFSNADNTTLYIGTAAHCMYNVSIGSEIMVGGIEDAGTLAYCSQGTRANGSGVVACPPPGGCTLGVCLELGSPPTDFALIEISPRYRDEVHPAVMGYGGPSGLDGDAALGDKVLTFGNSPYRDPANDRLDAREGYVERRSTWHTWSRIVGHTFGGDSGSPVATTDGALGVLVATDPRGGQVLVQNLDRELSYLHENTNLTVEIKTWDLLDDGVLPSP